MSKKTCANPRMNRVGGQAVLEGVMMKSGDNVALSVRKDDGKIETETRKFTSVVKKHKALNIPILRGVINMVETFRLSYSILGRSAEMLGIDDAEAESKFDRWLKEKFGDKLMNVVMVIAAILGVALALFLFSFLPTLAIKWLGGLMFGSTDELAIGQQSLLGLIQGLIKIAIFVGYILLVSLMPDIKRTFQYHGAEHKSIACFESGDELTPENASKHTRLHPRCGTSFIFVTLILSILVFSPLPLKNTLVRVGLQFLFLPLVIGLSYEFIMYAGRHRNVLTAILSAPGLAMQRITTKEPSLEQLEVALTSLKAAMPDEFPPEKQPEDAAADKPEASGEAKEGEADGASEAPEASAEPSLDDPAYDPDDRARELDPPQTSGTDGKSASDGESGAK